MSEDKSDYRADARAADPEIKQAARSWLADKEELDQLRAKLAGMEPLIFAVDQAYYWDRVSNDRYYASEYRLEAAERSQQYWLKALDIYGELAGLTGTKSNG